MERFRFVILKIYNSLYRRIHSWGLFIVLFCLYLSSFGLNSSLALSLFSRIGLVSLHILSGFGLILIIVIIGYNTVLHSLLKQNPESEPPESVQRNPSEDRRYRPIVDVLFYLLLIVIAGLGLVYYLVKFYGLNLGLTSTYRLSLNHVILGWFTLSIVFIRYYFTIIRWFKEFLAYLREY